jgi:NADH-quinone oxidoreductase subunit N
MSFPTPDLALALPEIVLLTAVSVVLVVDLFLNDSQRHWTYLLSLMSLVIVAAVTVQGAVGAAEITFSGTFIRDPMGDALKLISYLVVGVVFLYSRPYLADRGLMRGEFFILGLFALLGMMVMISAHHFLTIYLGLELLSLSLYAMVAFDRDSAQSSEAAMKYFVLGALASGMLLYGISILYGITGHLGLVEVARGVASRGPADIPVLVGLAFVIVGIAFKLGAVPFHMWLPDVYQGAPTATTLFIGTAPKLAAFALVMRVLVEGLGDVQSAWSDILVLLAVLSIGLGNFAAIAQTSIKRMLAYSTISHVGFILLGFLPGTAVGYSSSMFYTVAYVFMAAGAFGIVLALSHGGKDVDALDDFKGLGRSSPASAAIMGLLMFGMAGVPPMVGFQAKLLVIRAALDADLTWLAVFAVAMSVIGAYYYLRVVKLMYFDENEEPLTARGSWDRRAVLTANGLAVVALGIFPAGLLALCLRVLPT